MSHTGDIAQAREYASLYRSRGLNPLPSRPDAKRPCLRYRQYFAEPCPVDVFERYQTTNIQVVCGQPWGLLVVDCDGAGAIERVLLTARATRGRLPATWISCRGDGSESLHLWYRMPPRYNALPRATLWQGEGSHCAVERIGERSLIMAPPSIHPTRGERYRFVRGRSPCEFHRPSIAPDWLMRWAPIATTQQSVATVPFVLPSVRPVVGGYRTREVREAIVDKIGLAASWGVRFTGRGDQWAQCHAIDRDDRNPSAAVHRESGYYRDLGPNNAKLDFFQLAVACGAYPDVDSAITDLASRYLHANIDSGSQHSQHQRAHKSRGITLRRA